MRTCVHPAQCQSVNLACLLAATLFSHCHGLVLLASFANQSIQPTHHLTKLVSFLCWAIVFGQQFFTSPALVLLLTISLFFLSHSTPLAFSHFLAQRQLVDLTFCLLLLLLHSCLLTQLLSLIIHCRQSIRPRQLRPRGREFPSGASPSRLASLNRRCF